MLFPIVPMGSAGTRLARGAVMLRDGRRALGGKLSRARVEEADHFGHRRRAGSFATALGSPCHRDREQNLAARSTEIGESISGLKARWARSWGWVRCR